jgi:hypothetical protein
MEITGKKNLELTKRALMSHLVYCSHHALRSSDSVAHDKWDPEIKEVNTMLDAVEHNLKRITATDEEPTPGNGIVYTVGI